MSELYHWANFYKTREPRKEPSNFAKFAVNWIEKGKTVYDIGSGNGRDSVFLARKNQVISVDPVGTPYRQPKKLKHMVGTVKDIIGTEIAENAVVYSRFLIHAITRKETRALVKWSKGLFIAEFRIKGDTPKIYTDHKRELWDSDDILKLFKDWELLYFYKGRGVAHFARAVKTKFKIDLETEDPLCVRIIAKRK